MEWGPPTRDQKKKNVKALALQKELRIVVGFPFPAANAIYPMAFGFFFLAQRAAASLVP